MGTGIIRPARKKTVVLQIAPETGRLPKPSQIIAEERNRPDYHIDPWVYRHEKNVIRQHRIKGAA